MIAISNLNDIPLLPTSAQPLIAKIVENAFAAYVAGQTFILVIEADDCEAAVAATLGFNPLHNPMDGLRFDESQFAPYWAYLTLEDGWYRLIHTVGNDGFAYELVIEAAGGGPFHAMCRGG